MSQLGPSPHMPRPLGGPPCAIAKPAMQIAIAAGTAALNQRAMLSSSTCQKHHRAWMTARRTALTFDADQSGPTSRLTSIKASLLLRR
jgi:hypothetical protein